MYTLENRKPRHQLENADTWIRDANGACVGTFIPNPIPTFRPKTPFKQEVVDEVLTQFKARQGKPIHFTRHA